MLSETTAEKVRLVMLVIRWNQLKGNIPEGQPVSTAAMAEVASSIGMPVSEQTFRRVSQVALTKARMRAITIKSTLSHPSE